VAGTWTSSEVPAGETVSYAKTLHDSGSDRLVNDISRSLSQRVAEDSPWPVGSANLNSWLPDIRCAALADLR